MDNFSEQLVAKKRTGADIAKIVLTLAGCSVIGLAAIFFGLLTGFLVLILIGMAIIGVGIWLSTGFNVEYEYIITNNEMDIDKILGKRRRKRMITVDLSRATAFEPYPGTQESEADVIVHASTGTEEDAYFLVCEHHDYGKVEIIFNPNERTRNSIIHEFPGLLKQKVNDNG